MKFKHKATGTVVEPSNELAAQHFIKSEDWEEVQKETAAPKATSTKPPKNPAKDPTKDTKNPENEQPKE